MFRLIPVALMLLVAACKPPAPTTAPVTAPAAPADAGESSTHVDMPAAPVSLPPPAAPQAAPAAK